MNAPYVLITEPIAPGPLAWLRQHASVRVLGCPEPTDADLGGAQALIVRTYTRVDAHLLGRAPQLRVVARAGVGLDNIDLDACKARSIPVVHTPEANAEAVVEYVAAMMLGAIRPIEPLTRPVDATEWTALRAAGVAPSSCVGTAMGIVGMGRIGSRVAGLARALSMDARYHDLRTIPEEQRRGARPTTLTDLARESRVVTIHVDGRRENDRVFSSAFFGALRDDAIVINASRGFVIDTDAALDFARVHPDARLILDVHNPEPIPASSPLWSQPNITLTPHIAAGTRQAKEAMSWVVRDVVRVLTGEPPRFPAT